MGFSTGYDNTESESKFYIRYKNVNYGKFLSNLMKIPPVNNKLDIEFNSVKSPFSMKYAFIFKNIFFLKLQNNMLKFDIEAYSKSKLIKMVNFDVLPGFKFTVKNNHSSFPFRVNFKYGKYQASRDQVFRKYDISSVLHSLLPYNVTSVDIVHENGREFELNNQTNETVTAVYRAKAALKTIHGYENCLKLSGMLKLFYTRNIMKKFDLKVSNELNLSKSIVFNNQYENKQPHVLSGFDCVSKILGIDVLTNEQDQVLNSGSNYVLKNVTALRACNIQALEEYEVSKYIEPFVSLETFFLPYSKKKKLSFSEEQVPLSDYFKFILAFGVSLKVNEVSHINLMLYTKGFNLPISQNGINKFRIQLYFK